MATSASDVLGGLGDALVDGWAKVAAAAERGAQALATLRAAAREAKPNSED